MKNQNEKQKFMHIENANRIIKSVVNFDQIIM